MKLFAVFLGGRAPKCNIELHDVVFTCSNTNQLTFKTQVQKANGTEGTIYYRWYSESIHTMQLLEIAQ